MLDGVIAQGTTAFLEFKVPSQKTFVDFIIIFRQKNETLLVKRFGDEGVTYADGKLKVVLSDKETAVFSCKLGNVLAQVRGTSSEGYIHLIGEYRYRLVLMFDEEIVPPEDIPTKDIIFKIIEDYFNTYKVIFTNDSD